MFVFFVGGMGGAEGRYHSSRFFFGQMKCSRYLLGGMNSRRCAIVVRWPKVKENPRGSKASRSSNEIIKAHHSNVYFLAVHFC